MCTRPSYVHPTATVPCTPLVSCPKLLVRDQAVSLGFEPINPLVADAIAKLLLLAPQPLLGEQWAPLVIEGLAQDVLLNTACTHLNNLILWFYLLPRASMVALLKCSCELCQMEA